jgi:hypothetical protein
MTSNAVPGPTRAAGPPPRSAQRSSRDRTTAPRSRPRRGRPSIDTGPPQSTADALCERLIIAHHSPTPRERQAHQRALYAEDANAIGGA